MAARKFNGNGSRFTLTGIVHRLDRVEIGADGHHVLARHPAVIGKGHRRIEPRAVAADALAGPRRRIASSVQAPIPVSRSGVMLGAARTPNGVSIGRPPANGWSLPGTVWQLPQSAAVAR